MIRKAIGVLLLVGLALAAPASAAEPKGKQDEATTYFDRGALQYNLGHFQEAIPEFEKAYQLEPSPILLFNLAQCHRQIGNKDRALFMYKRYLEHAPKAPNRADVKKRIAELEEAIQREDTVKAQVQAQIQAQEAARAREAAGMSTQPPPVPQYGDTPPTTVSRPSTGPGIPPLRRPWTLAAFAAPVFMWFSGNDLQAPVVFAMRVSGAYGVPVRGGTIRLGLDADLALLPFVNAETGERQTSSLYGALASARYLFRVQQNLEVGAGVGAGFVWWSGLAPGNPFTVGYAGSNGPVPMPTFKAGLYAGLALGGGLYAALVPELIISKTTSAGLTHATSSISRLDLTIGLGYEF